MWIYLGLIATLSTAVCITKLYRGLTGIFREGVENLLTRKISKILVSVDKKTFTITYPYGMDWYKIIVPRKRGPKIVSAVYDEYGKDITGELKPYMGPGQNFHGVPTTPEKLGYELLSFQLLDDSVRVFGNTDLIQLP